MYLRCANCTTSFKIVGLNKHLSHDLENDKIVCPVCVEPCVMLTVFGSESSRELTADQFWTASNGFGLPDEIVTEPLTVESMLLSSMVVGVDLVKTDTGRVEIKNLKLNNGVTLHLAASGSGAVVFKMTKEKRDASRRAEESEIRE